MGLFGEHGVFRSRNRKLLDAAKAGDASRVAHIANKPKGIFKAPATVHGAALLIAANDGFSDTVSALLEAGADPNTRTHTMETALHFAARASHCSTVAVLVADHRTSINAADAAGDLPIHRAAAAGDVDTLKNLVFFDTKRDGLYVNQRINARNNKGDTPLHIAINRGHHLAACFLLSKAHADPSFVSSSETSALELARSAGMTEFVEFAEERKRLTEIERIADDEMRFARKSQVPGVLIDADFERERRVTEANLALEEDQMERASRVREAKYRTGMEQLERMQQNSSERMACSLESQRDRTASIDIAVTAATMEQQEYLQEVRNADVENKNQRTTSKHKASAMYDRELASVLTRRKDEEESALDDRREALLATVENEEQERYRRMFANIVSGNSTTVGQKVHPKWKEANFELKNNISQGFSKLGELKSIRNNSGNSAHSRRNSVQELVQIFESLNNN